MQFTYKELLIICTLYFGSRYIKKEHQRFIKKCKKEGCLTLIYSKTDKDTALNLMINFNIKSKVSFHLFVRSISQIYLIHLHFASLLVLWACIVASSQKGTGLE